MSDPNRDILAAVLEWSIAMGADIAVADEPTDWLADGRGPPGAGFALTGDDAGIGVRPEPGAMVPAVHSTPLQSERSPHPGAAARAQPPRQPAAAASRRFATAAPDVAVGAARTAARSATSLEGLKQALETFDRCSLKATAKNLCFYRGAAQAPLMIIGEAPGRDEDMEGRPFVGQAGQMLDRMLAAAGWGEADVHITSIVYWRPPGNRAPTQQETDVCRPFLDRQIELVAPRVLLLMGGAATKQIFRTDEGILKTRGRWQTLEFGALKLPAIATLHPVYLMRTPIAKRQAWLDILKVSQALRA